MSAPAYLVREAAAAGLEGEPGYVVSLADTSGFVLGPYPSRGEAQRVAQNLNHESRRIAQRLTAAALDRERLRLHGSEAPLERREREARVALDEATAKALRAVALIDEAHGAQLERLESSRVALAQRVETLEARLERLGELHSVRTER